jgi:hypothetical protein
MPYIRGIVNVTWHSAAHHACEISSVSRCVHGERSPLYKARTPSFFTVCLKISNVFLYIP